MRESYTAQSSRKAEITCTSPDETAAFDELLRDPSPGGFWTVVIRTIDLGVDWPQWWPLYAAKIAAYRAALGDVPAIRDLLLPEAKLRDESWRRYDICKALRYATCEEVHYPDFFEVVALVGPERLDDTRETFPDGAFGRYVMSCPPRSRLVDPRTDFVLDVVWSEHAAFFKEAGLLLNRDAMPLEVVIAEAKNAALRDVLERHAVKPSTLRTVNEKLALTILEGDESEEQKLREGTIPPDRWCRMQPDGLTWDEFQAFRWQSRGMISQLHDYLDGLTYTA